MGVFNFFKRADINHGVEEYQNTANAVLLDVRTPQEYSDGHIPTSKNIPLQVIDKVKALVKNKDVPLFVYCYSGSRSSQAVIELRRMGYTNVKNIGGISAYAGKVER